MEVQHMKLYNPFWFDDSNGLWGEGFEPKDDQSPSFYSCNLGSGEEKSDIS